LLELEYEFASVLSPRIVEELSVAGARGNVLDFTRIVVIEDIEDGQADPSPYVFVAGFQGEGTKSLDIAGCELRIAVRVARADILAILVLH
jgi:hypothetical protein